MLTVLVIVVALVWANSPVSDTYSEFWHQDVGFNIGAMQLHMSLRHWINDGLIFSSSLDWRYAKNSPTARCATAAVCDWHSSLVWQVSAFLR